MEFADVIRVPRCERVLLHQPHKEKLETTLAITSHHLILAPRAGQGEELWVRTMQINPLLASDHI